MKTKSSLASTNCPNTLIGRFRTTCAASLLPLLLVLTPPAAVQAQFDYPTNNRTITITGYTGPGGDVVIPDAITGLPVTTIGDYAFQYCTSLTSPKTSALRCLTLRPEGSGGNWGLGCRSRATRGLFQGWQSLNAPRGQSSEPLLVVLCASGRDTAPAAPSETLDRYRLLFT